MKSIFLIVILFLIFTIFSHRVERGFLKQLDFDTTVKIQEKIDKSARLRTQAVISNILEGSVYLAGPTTSTAVVILLAIIFGIDYKKKKIQPVLFLIPVAFFLLVLAEIYGKSVVHHPAPPFFMLKNPITLFPKYHVLDNYSYPSGHAARAVFTAILFTMINQKSIKRKFVLYLISAGYVFLVSFSVIYLGHHWLSDIIGGTIIGLALGLIPVIFYGKK